MKHKTQWRVIHGASRFELDFVSLKEAKASCRERLDSQIQELSTGYCRYSNQNGKVKAIVL